MQNSSRFPFIPTDAALGQASLRPTLPITLTLWERSLNIMGLLDTGAALNVLPYQIGVSLGAMWNERATPLYLTGNLANYPAQALLVSATVSPFDAVPLVFAWTRATDVPLLLGQVNFFMEFDVCFYRSQLIFEVRPRSP